ncbi:MAG: HAMP domain-containing histidine kinase [Deltaproteobacteria bacterium]|nr:HAMP domain-containing histidine kinase [Deltaproteobacteria bacterium]
MRRLLALTLGVALPTILLSGGWLRASGAERDAVEREQRTRLERSADTIRAAVDEGLEELRRREDARPFYLYNHFYSPPSVVAVNDPVAITPLALTPQDARVVGYFQIDPDGTLRTPYTVTVGAPDTPRSRRIRRLLAAPEFAGLRALTHAQGQDEHSLLAAASPPARIANAPAPTLRGERRSGHRSGSRDGMTSGRDGPKVDNAFGPQGPLTLNLNTWGNEVYEDIQAAQAGDLEATLRVQARGRAAPLTRRREVPWGAYGAVAQQAQSLTRPPPVPAPIGPTLANRTQQEAEVGYTDMAWYELGQEVLLHRIVSHGGAAVVQGVVLDRAQLVEHWLPSLVRRHSATDTPDVVAAGERADCSYRPRVSHILTGVELCYPEAASGTATAALDASQNLQRGALVGLLLIVAVALFTFDRSVRRSEELTRQKSAFVSAVSHELRTPLTTIRMHAEMLEEGLVSEARRPTVYAELVHESVRLARLVENVLEVSRLEEGQRPLRVQFDDLRAHVEEVVSHYRPFAERRGFRVTGPGEGSPVELHFDRQALEQIVVNLLDNALKYAASGRREVHVSVDVEDGQALLSVRDHGPGIPVEERERVLERFHRVERAETIHNPGTGIGLSLVHDLAQAHGGFAEVREADGGGALVIVSLPLV